MNKLNAAMAALDRLEEVKGVDRHRTGGGGVSIVTVLTIIFVVLKLTGLIDWSWMWVLSPIWITFLLTIFIVGLLSIVFYIMDKH